MGFDELRIEFAAFLGVEEAIPDDVIEAALSDALYAHHLLACRGNPIFLKHLISNPPRSREISISVPRAITSKADLVLRASKALVKWAAQGFAVVDREIFEQRIASCRQCPYLDGLSIDGLYRVLQDSKSNVGVCTRCGCLVGKKARMASESCPEKSPNNLEMTRWHEPISLS